MIPDEKQSNEKDVAEIEVKRNKGNRSEAITVPVVIGALCFARKGWRNTPKFWITSEYKNGRKITLGGLRWSQSLAHCTVPMCLHESLKI